MSRISLRCENSECVSIRPGHPQEFVVQARVDGNGLLSATSLNGEQPRSVQPEHFKCVYCGGAASDTAPEALLLQPIHRAMILLGINKLQFKGSDGRKAARIKTTCAFHEDQPGLELTGIVFKPNPSGGLTPVGFVPTGRPSVLRKTLEESLEGLTDDKREEVTASYRKAEESWARSLAARGPSEVRFYSSDLSLMRAEFADVEMPGELSEEWYSTLEILGVDLGQD